MYDPRSRYYNLTRGRFINADALVSTGQGILGNNMFAYCLNNPVNFLDSEGSSAICVTNGDRNPLMIGHIGLGGGGAGGGSSNGYKDIAEEITDKSNGVLSAVGSFAKAGWDAYMRGRNIQQETQQSMDVAMYDVAVEVYQAVSTSKVVPLEKAGFGIYNTIYNVVLLFGDE